VQRLLFFAADGKITINGRVITSTCTLTGSGTGGTGKQNVTVTLPTVLNSAFTANSAVQATNFTLSLTNDAGYECRSICERWYNPIG